ncbi:hypothetical protein GCM10025868_01170 [Angustibacter aerolatus]|uniref:Uncharacterized protein n=1 Tax=Angustibacter aerolatus TaxID=1162965 RepID=A0ABQ6J9M1_9ACTN|nr:hypothetical protein GCM10025868_01170 [Angustibacter aerolatus]
MAALEEQAAFAHHLVAGSEPADVEHLATAAREVAGRARAMREQAVSWAGAPPAREDDRTG